MQRYRFDDIRLRFAIETPDGLKELTEIFHAGDSLIVHDENGRAARIDIDRPRVGAADLLIRIQLSFSRTSRRR